MGSRPSLLPAVVVAVALVVPAYGLVQQRPEQNQIDSHSLDGIMGMMRQPNWSRNFTRHIHPKKSGPLTLESFSWKTCGSPTDGVRIDTLSISPDPVKVGSPLMVTASGELSVDLAAPLEVDVVVQKKVFVWITLPCVDGLGSCTYGDVCSQLPPPPCPMPFQQKKLPCVCPFAAGKYDVSDVEVAFDQKKFPEWLSEGEFKAHVVLKMKGQQVGCYDFALKTVAA